LGADERLFAYQRAMFPNLMVPKWIKPKNKESLSAYAHRFAKTLQVERPFYLGGASFGGMVALEMAKQLKPEGVILIGSARDAKMVPFYDKGLIKLFPLLPALLVYVARNSPRFRMFFFGVTRKEHRETFNDMLLKTPNRFLCWAIKAIFSWKGCAVKGIRVLHIHGKQDELIPLRKINPDVVIKDGGHLVNLTHADEVNRYIRNFVER
jgi:pimeloyl-ACP methyl ester carboxylesterase